MKNMKLSSIVVLLLAMLFCTSCIDDEKDDFNTPDLTIVEPNIENVIPTNAIVSQLLNNNLSNFFIEEYIDIFDDRNDILPITFESTDNYIEGYVISSDESGNFFEELVIQDKLENPIYGIKILVDVNPLFTRFQLGQKVFIKLDGLSFNISNGVLTLGILNSDVRLEKISESLINDFIIPSTEVGTIVPKEINLISETLVLDTNLFVSINNMQFHRSHIFPEPQSFANENTDEFDGERLLESCENDGTIILSTSTFSDFKSLTLPFNKGTIQGVLTRNFFGDTINLNINSTEDINFDNSERCDPLVFNFDFDSVTCNDATTGNTIVYSEDFESFTDLNPWSTINLSGGETNWILGDFDNSNYAQISGFNSDESDIDVLLVSETFNLDNTESEKLNFDIQVNFDNGNILTVLISEDYVDNVYTATWSNLNVTIPTGPSGGFGDFQAVNTADISCLNGNVTLAFLYKGSDPSATTRYHIDNVEITGN